jgi:hypothetical protein
MASYDNSKPVSSVFPDRAIDAQEWRRVEPLITPEQLTKRFLFGIPLVSYFINPVTNQRDELTSDDLKDFIERGVAEAELQTGLTIFPVQYDEKHPFDRNFWISYGYIKVEHRPVMSIEKFAFTPPSGQDIFSVNLDWIESANFHKGQINLIPFVPAIAGGLIGGTNTGNPGGGAAYLHVMSGLAWVPAFIRVTYTAGFPNAVVPKVVNEIIGCNAAIEVLNALQITNRAQSYSMSIDGASQSMSTPGPQAFQPKIDYLEKKRDGLIRRLKNLYGLGVFSSHV